MMIISATSEYVNAADIESLVMPGEVASAHADIESECSNCHKMFQKSEQNNLCLDCHEDVASDFNTHNGFHGKSGETQDENCSVCHADHLGRGADIMQLDEDAFDHDLTDFLLVGEHLNVECTDCHEPDEKHRDAAGECFGCHEADDSHDGKLGEACGDCHNAETWLEITFDHSQTDFSLTGEHQSAPCTGCHVENQFQDTPDDCFSCHEADDAHQGLSGENCGNCHSPTGWEDTSFDHQRDTQFPIDGAHAELECGGCHSKDPFADKLETGCLSCHEDDDEHLGHFGADCANCHVTSEWQSSAFDHDRDTDYALSGAHAETACADCHVEPIFDVALNSACNDCHQDDDVHEGSQGDQCQSCHNETSWTENVVFDHELTKFPLLGKHIDAECDACHLTQVYSDVETTCESCHIDDDPHDGRFSGTCDSCHNPVDWEIWFFDHNRQTKFPLDGAHAQVACNDCHRQPIKSMFKLNARCGDCHRADDVHDGEFGANCERCHSAASFRDVRSLQ